MKRESKTRKGSYYKRIVIWMLVFIACVVIPFTAILYHLSEKNVLERINESNEHVLQQMKYNFTYISDNMSSLCLSVFLLNDVAEIMYSIASKYNDVYSLVKNLEDSMIQAQSSLASILIYNANTKNWYSANAGDNEISEIKSFLEGNGDVPKLKPILRKVELGTNQIQADGYVFSYFMYEYSNPSSGKGSFIVLNQTADAFIDNLNAGASGSSEIYIANKNGDIYGGRGGGNSVGEKIAKECMEKQSEEMKSGYYVHRHEGEKYLISYINLDDTMNTIVMIQNYQDIFSGMTELRNEFILLCAIYAVMASIAIMLLSKRIYNPVNELVSYVSEVDEQSAEETVIEDPDEIQHLRRAFQRAKKVTDQLQEERNNSQKIVDHYWLSSLLKDSSEERIEAFYKNMPQSVLSINRNYCIAVVRMKLDSYEKNRFSFEKDDNKLLLDSARNVFQELLEEDFESETVPESDGGIVLILNGVSQEKSCLNIRNHIRNMQKFMTEHFDVTISVAYSRIGRQITEIAELYEEAGIFLNYKLVYGKSAVLGREECKENIENTDTTYSRELRKKLDEQLKLGKREEICQVLDEIRDSIAKLSYENIVVNTMALITQINTVLSEINMMKKRFTPIRFDKVYQDALNMEFLEQIFTELKDYIESVQGETYQHTERENDKEELFVETVIGYVEENFADVNLTSQSIADHIGMSGRYVMKKFKKCAGITLNEYILSVRMKRAVHFLTETDMPISQIAENIGIYNENYFYRLFKKVYGCTPREYAARERGIAEEEEV